MSALVKKLFGSRSGRSSVRVRVLAIAFVPSITLLLVGVALAGYLIYDAVKDRDFATKVHEAAEPGAVYFAAVREERRLTLENLASGGQSRVAMEQQRSQTDAAARGILAHLEGMIDDAPANVLRDINLSRELYEQLPEFRQRIDTGAPSLQEAYDFYNRIIDTFAAGLNGVAQQAPDAETAYLRVTAMPLFTAADGMSRADGLAAAGYVGGGLTEQEFRTYIGQVGAYHTQLQLAAPEMIPSVRDKYEQLQRSQAWQVLGTVENAFLRGNADNLPVSDEQWRTAAREVGAAMMGLYIEQSTNATNVGLDAADRTLITAIIAGVVALLLGLVLIYFAWRLSKWLVERLARLREETLDLAEGQLPELVSRVRSGEHVDLDSEVAFLDHGEDEIGQVADAFNKAQQTAIAAAVEEAKTREGTKNVFLNIAHRSQVIVHRQLKALDEAERKQEDPDQLDMLFRLDHLSTRARRNAENLIILGGEQPGRQWRKPVALTDLVRGATAETEDYQRVTVGKLPDVAVSGPVVADLIHLLAELIDNATSFSPPRSRVEIRGETVGRGVVVEVEDQGLGIEPEQVEELNQLLRNPPDFSFMALSDEPRLGLFVVARLAARHGIQVTLRDSAYGGTRAIVLVRSDLLSSLPEPEDDVIAEDAVPAQVGPSVRRRVRPEAYAETNGDTAAAAAPAAATEQAGPPELPKREPRRELPRRPPRREEALPAVDQPQRGELPRHAQPASPADHQQRPELPRRGAAAHRADEPAGPPTDVVRPAGTHEARRPSPEPRAPEGRSPDARPPQPGGPMAPGRPPLPRRRKQENLVPQLKETAAATDEEDVVTDSPEQARSRLAAFQRGTRQAREQDSGHNLFSGD